MTSYRLGGMSVLSKFRSMHEMFELDANSDPNVPFMPSVEMEPIILPNRLSCPFLDHLTSHNSGRHHIIERFSRASCHFLPEPVKFAHQAQLE